MRLPLLSTALLLSLCSLTLAQGSNNCVSLDIYVEDALTHTPLADALVVDITTGSIVTTDLDGMASVLGGAGGLDRHTFEVNAAGYPTHYREVEMAVVDLGTGTSCSSDMADIAALRLCPQAMYMSSTINSAGGVFRFTHTTSSTIDGTPFTQTVRIVVPPNAWDGRYRIGVTPVDPGAFTTAYMPNSSVGEGYSGVYQYPLAELRLSLFDLSGNLVDLGILPEPIRIETTSARVDRPFIPGSLIGAITFNEATKLWSPLLGDKGHLPSSSSYFVELESVRNLTLLPIYALSGSDLAVEPEPCEWSLLNKHTIECGDGEAAPLDSITILGPPSCGTVFGQTELKIETTFGKTIDWSMNQGLSAKLSDKLLSVGYQAGAKVGSKQDYSKKFSVTKRAGQSYPGKQGTLYVYPIETQYIYEYICPGGVVETETFTISGGTCWATSQLSDCP